MRTASLLLALTLSAGGAYAAPAALNHSLPGDDASLDTPFSVHSETRIPGKVLKPGGYTITIKDHLSDRAIIQVTNDKGKLESTFLGVFHSGLQGSGSTGPIPLSIEKGHDTLRGFTFPGGGTIEFVYPKAEAAAIATSSPEQVLAIDPESDNLHVKDNNLSTEDAKIVTLWSLQATRVQAGQTGIAAKKYVAPAAAPEPVTATAVRPAAPVAPAPAAVAPAAPVRPAAQVVAKKPAPPVSNQVASSGRRPSISALPHTASQMPLLLLIAFGALTGAAGTRVAAVRASAK